MNEIERKRKDIEILKKDLKLKEKAFDLIIKVNTKKLKEFLLKHEEVLIYLTKFATSTDSLIIFSISGDFIFNIKNTYIIQIREDLEKIQEKIDVKEEQLDQKIFLEQQQKFIELQKEDLIDNKKDRNKIKNFTFILALGVIIAAIFYLYTLTIRVVNSNNTWELIISGIFFIILALLILFIITTFNAWKEVRNFFDKQWLTIIISVIVIIFLIWFLFSIPNVPIKEDIIQTSINNLTQTIKNQSLIINQPIYLQDTLVRNNTNIIYLNPKT